MHPLDVTVLDGAPFAGATFAMSAQLSRDRTSCSFVLNASKYLRAIVEDECRRLGRALPFSSKAKREKGTDQGRG